MTNRDDAIYHVRQSMDDDEMAWNGQALTALVYAVLDLADAVREGHVE